MKKRVIGIDIGGTYTKYGFVCQDGVLTHEGSIPTDKFPDITNNLGLKYKYPAALYITR